MIKRVDKYEKGYAVTNKYGRVLLVPEAESEIDAIQKAVAKDQRTIILFNDAASHYFQYREETDLSIADKERFAIAKEILCEYYGVEENELEKCV